MTDTTAKRDRFKRGFERTSKLLDTRIRKASESRGFAESRLLTHWEEIAGEAFANVSRPVEVSYARGGFGATLTLLTTGANAPMLEMQKEKLREKVNAVYGYAAIARVRITQTAPTGFAEGQADFTRPAPPKPKVQDPEITARATSVAQPVKDDALRDALAALAANVYTRNSQKT